MNYHFIEQGSNPASCGLSVIVKYIITPINHLELHGLMIFTVIYIHTSFNYFFFYIFAKQKNSLTFFPFQFYELPNAVDLPRC